MPINGVLLDLAGVVYQGKTLIPGSSDAIARLRAASLKIRFVTNTTRSSKRVILANLADFGLEVGDEELFTPVEAARAWLSQNRCTPELLVHPALADAFSGLIESRSRAVVVGDAGEGFTYAGMNRAFRALVNGGRLLALAKNRTFKDVDGQLSLDAGPFVAALEFASGQGAVVLGKPSREFFASALTSMGCAFEDAVIVGDDAEADVAGARSAGVGRAILVRTGKYCHGDEHRFDTAPSVTVTDLAEAAEWILANRM